MADGRPGAFSNVKLPRHQAGLQGQPNDITVALTLVPTWIPLAWPMPLGIPGGSTNCRHHPHRSSVRSHRLSPPTKSPFAHRLFRKHLASPPVDQSWLKAGGSLPIRASGQPLPAWRSEPEAEGGANNHAPRAPEEALRASWGRDRPEPALSTPGQAWGLVVR